jgi:hypothetical protein
MKQYFPFPTLTSASGTLLQSTAHVYIPAYNYRTDPFRLSSSVNKKNDHIDDENKSSFLSPFTPQWLKVKLELMENGILNFYEFETDTLIYKIDIKDYLSSGIRQLDYSVFHSFNVLYIGDFSAITLNQKHSKSAVGPWLPRSTKHTHNLAHNKHQHQHNPQECYRQHNLIKHTKFNTCKSDPAIYVKFETEEGYHQWFISLKSLTRIHVYSPSTGDLEKSFRIARLLEIRILEAKLDFLQSPEHSESVSKYKNPEVYVEVCCYNRVWCRTSVSKPTELPFWREDFKVNDITSPCVPNILFYIRRRSSVEGDDPKDDLLLGLVELTHEQLKTNGDSEVWYKFTTGDLIQGSLCLKIRLEELNIVSAHHYEEVQKSLSEISDQTLALLAMSENHIQRSDLSPVSDICLNISLATSTVMPVVRWINALISQEIEKTRVYVVKKQGRDCFKSYCTREQHEYKRNYVNTMFRGNTILTKSLEKLMRIVGHSYLKRIIGSFVLDIVNEQPELEIDPSKLGISTFNFEDMSEEERKTIESNQARLLKFTTQLWESIRDTVDDLPISFKLIFKHLGFELTNILQQSKSGINNSVAGFLFLRFFCPGLLNPKLFGFVDSQQASLVQRPLTLITKIIMAFASRSRFGMKEPWMVPMNVFLDGHEPELLQYFDNVTLAEEDGTKIEAVIDSANFTLGVLPKNFTMTAIASPLHERVQNLFLLDEHLNFARYFEIWRNLIRPNKDSIYKTIKSFLEERSEILKSDNEEKDEKEYEDIYNVLDVIVVDSPEPIPEISFDQAWAQLTAFHEKVEACCKKVDHIVRDLNKKETFEPHEVPAYAKHISISWDPHQGILRYIPGIRAHNDHQMDQNLSGSLEREKSIMMDTDPRDIILETENDIAFSSSYGSDFSSFDRQRDEDDDSYELRGVNPKPSTVDATVSAPDIMTLSLNSQLRLSIEKSNSSLPELDIDGPKQSDKNSSNSIDRKGTATSSETSSKIRTPSPGIFSPPSASTGELSNHSYHSSTSKRLPRWFKNWP